MTDGSGEGADELAGGVGIPSDTTSEDRRELRWAEEMTKAQRFGLVGKIVFPFSNQLKNEIRRTFEIDSSIFKDADKAYNAVRRLYTVLRIVTFGLFLLFAVAALLLFARALGSQRIDSVESIRGLAPDLPLERQNWLEAIATLVAVAALLLLLRQGMRAWFFLRIERQAERFASSVSRRNQAILQRVLVSCTQAQTMGREGTWHDRALNSIKLALWNGKRSEYLDRYSTTIAWQLRYFFLTSEAAFTIAKVVVGVAVAFVLVSIWRAAGGSHSMSDNMAAAGFFLVYAAAAIFGWYFLGRRKLDFWTEAFVADLHEVDNKVSYFTAVPAVAENLVRQLISNLRGTGD